MRIGHGYDVHRLVADRKLILGGVEIPHSLGLLGHSDADVLLHAISDALLGAAALGDIGQHFPDTDEKYRGISSLLLLREVSDLVNLQGLIVENIDATIVAQRPKLRPYIDMMREILQRHWALISHKSMSRPQQRKVLELVEVRRAYVHMRFAFSVQFLIFPIYRQVDVQVVVAARAMIFRRIRF